MAQTHINLFIAFSLVLLITRLTSFDSVTEYKCTVPNCAKCVLDSEKVCFSCGAGYHLREDTSGLCEKNLRPVTEIEEKEVVRRNERNARNRESHKQTLERLHAMSSYILFFGVLGMLWFVFVAIFAFFRYRRPEYKARLLEEVALYKENKRMKEEKAERKGEDDSTNTLRVTREPHSSSAVSSTSSHHIRRRKKGPRKIYEMLTQDSSGSDDDIYEEDKSTGSESGQSSVWPNCIPEDMLQTEFFDEECYTCISEEIHAGVGVPGKKRKHPDAAYGDVFFRPEVGGLLLNT